ncbi:hypothetical protein BXZ70DRAFT_911092, partial [Cristinia sonorae]
MWIVKMASSDIKSFAASCHNHHTDCSVLFAPVCTASTSEDLYPRDDGIPSESRTQSKVVAGCHGEARYYLLARRPTTFKNDENPSLQGLLYGISIPMFIFTFWVLVRNGRARRRYNYTVLAASASLLLLSTAEFALDILRLVRGVVVIGPELPGGIEQYFSDVLQISWTVKGILYSCQTLILDAVVIYRAYAVWRSATVVLLPVLGWLGVV